MLVNRLKIRHSKKQLMLLIKAEIEYWQDKKDEDESESVTTYIEKMSAILNVVKSCKNGKECVLRLGHGSGWRFITGA